MEKSSRLRFLQQQREPLRLLGNRSQQQALSELAIVTRTCMSYPSIATMWPSKVLKFTHIGKEAVSFDQTAWLQLNTEITRLRVRKC
jgi:hypothetical protein